MPARPRELPYVHVAYLSKLIAGESHCEWGAWFRSQNYFDRRTGDTYNGSDHQIKHTRLLRKQQIEMEGEGFTLTVEKQNDFVMEGSAAKLAGKPDLIGLLDEQSLIVDVKSGAKLASHEVQVLIYMWAVPLFHLRFPKFAGRKFRGLLVYEDDYRFIEPEKLTPVFIKDVIRHIQRLADAANPGRKVPSAMECKFCPINETDCADRVTDESGAGEVIPGYF